MNLEEILKIFKNNINWYKIRERGNNKILAINFKHETCLKEILKRISESFVKKSERIISRISCGEIIDLDIKSFEIIEGFFIEYYDYEKQETCFIRIYKIKDIKTNKIYTNLYIDLIKNSAWW